MIIKNLYYESLHTTYVGQVGWRGGGLGWMVNTLYSLKVKKDSVDFSQGYLWIFLIMINKVTPSVY